ncbi:unnamed protein product [Ixodes hexagonus]
MPQCSRRPRHTVLTKGFPLSLEMAAGVPWRQKTCTMQSTMFLLVAARGGKSSINFVNLSITTSRYLWCRGVGGRGPTMSTLSSSIGAVAHWLLISPSGFCR